MVKSIFWLRRWIYQRFNRYNGCRIYELSDINSNQLVKQGDSLVEVGAVAGEVDTHHGACHALDGMDGNILLSQLGELGAADAFQIIKTHTVWT